MAKTTCTIDGCGKPHEARGWCQMHYNRWRRHGDPGDPRPDRLVGVPPYEKVMARTRPEGDCVIFTGATHAYGYGLVTDMRMAGGMQLAHRIVMEHHHGESELFVLHSCDNPPCVNIEHLRYGTHSDNMADMLSRGRGRWQK